jgi:LL-diaminopimelate aminotransferase
MSMTSATPTITHNALPQTAERLHRTTLNPFAAINQRLQMMTAAGQSVIRLDIGSPDLPPPGRVVDALSRSAANPAHHGYSSYRGDGTYRRAMAEYYAQRFGVSLDPDNEVLPLIGSKEGIANLSLAYLDRGDAALVPAISYPTYAAGALLAGAETIILPMRPEDGYLPDLTAPVPGIERAKLLWVNYPNNPTGATATLAFYEQALAFCVKHNLILCSDNPYADVTFDGYRAPSALEIPGAKERTVEFTSLSKTYNMAGWRMGAASGNRDVLNELLRVKSNVDSASFRALYDAGTEALINTSEDWLAERNGRYAARRDLLMAALPDLGLRAEKPRATLYVWAKITDGRSEKEYAEEALDATSVSITPGTVYGVAGAGYVRFSLGISDSELSEALDRLREWHASQ